jgi:aminoglycoside phosphotransferase (APT) family kinase protein
LGSNICQDRSVNDEEGIEGRRKIAEGREAVIYEWDDGFVLRLMRSLDDGPALVHSTAASEAAREAGVSTPRVVDVIEVGGYPAQIIERVDGPDLFAHLASNPLRLPNVAAMLAKVHTELHRVLAPADLASSHDRFAPRIEASDLVPMAAKTLALGTLADLPTGDIICHGDFHPGNVLLSKAGPMLIDWTGATRGDPTADFARTRMMLQIGELPPGAPVVIKALATVGRGALWRLYDRAYRRGRSTDPDLLDRWTMVAATYRLTEDIEEERPALLDMIRHLDD